MISMRFWTQNAGAAAALLGGVFRTGAYKHVRYVKIDPCLSGAHVLCSGALHEGYRAHALDATRREYFMGTSKAGTSVACIPLICANVEDYAGISDSILTENGRAHVFRIHAAVVQRILALFNYLLLHTKLAGADGHVHTQRTM